MLARLIASLGIAAGTAIAVPQPAQAQLKPQPWVSVGSKSGDTSFSVGARFLDFGLELGTIEGATGVDVKRFIDLPAVSPYLGLGLYSADEGVALSGGVQFRPPGSLFLGVGYHSVRGANGQIGIKF